MKVRNIISILAMAVFMAVIQSCVDRVQDETGNEDGQEHKEEVIPSSFFSFLENDLKICPGQKAELSFDHAGVRIVSTTCPTGWSVDLSNPGVAIVLSPDGSGTGFATGGEIIVRGLKDDSTIVSNSLNVHLAGINSQDDWDRFCQGITNGFIVDGVLHVNSDVTASETLERLDCAMDAHGHTITLDIRTEGIRGGLFKHLYGQVRNLRLAGCVTLAVNSTKAYVAALAAECSDDASLKNVTSSADVILDMQTVVISPSYCHISPICAVGNKTISGGTTSGELRVLNCDYAQSLSGFGEDVICDKPTGCFSLRQLQIMDDTIGNSYILQTESGKVIVIDGGNRADCSNLCSNLAKYYGNTVDEWWISHPHGDHAGALIELLSKPKSEQPVIRKIVHSRLADVLIAVEAGSTSSLYKKLDAFEKEGGKVVDLQETGGRYDVDGVFIKVLGVQTPEFFQKGNPFPSPCNNASIVMRVWDREKSVIFLGDAQEAKGQKVLDEYGPYLHCDYLQMGHHGNWTCGRKFYDTVDFRVCLWPTPSYLWTSASGNAAGWDCWMYRQWMDAKGIKEHHPSCLGDWFLDMGKN